MSPVQDTLDHDDVPILIIGSGPCGLLLAFMLARLGVRSLIVERYPTRLDAPKAHALSPRSLELCRQFGLDVNKIRNIGATREDAHWVNFVTSLSGKLVGRLPYERMDAEVLNDTPTMIHNIPQPEFEDLIARELPNHDLVEVRKNHSFVRLENRSDCVLASIEDRSTQRVYTVRCTYLVGCDGAKSAVRRFLGIESEGEDSYETMMTIHINANLSPVIKERVGMLHWVIDPEVSGFIIGYDLSGNQVLICNFDSTKHPVGSWNESLCRKVVNAAIGTNVPYDVLSYRPWILSRKVAKAYRVNRVFLAGDAAHSFPPTGGLGLNSGLGDVHNLAYKLAAVLHGLGGDSLLDSYEFDRRHVAMVNSQQSVKNGKQIFGLLKAFGTTDSNMEVARRNLYRNIEDRHAMKDINQGIENQREHFDNLGLHIGYIYGDHRIPENASIYRPVCIRGGRLPHAWIRLYSQEETALSPIDSSYVAELSPKEVEMKRYSTLDLCTFDAFTLIADRGTALHWKRTLKEMCECLPAGISNKLKIRLVIRGSDFDLQPGKNGEDWVQLTKLYDGNAILVRPDQHILECFKFPAGHSGLLKVLREHLAWDTVVPDWHKVDSVL
ncbi:FAD binding domain-containing protein [Aspergillus parasiticus]|uniref:FAD binding domain-containing protein n=1 Tax=Aspergillus parasiticus TaxID=5067 RepID=A0A5N6DQ22_ASPPA|nr:FAD binding domain-containing protein [Aspergillus parasiticus]